MQGGSVAWRNNNPGNLKYGPLAIANGAIGEDANHFAIFPSYDAGLQALRQVVTKTYAGATINSMMNSYAPPSENNTATYIATLTQQLGVPGTTAISALSQAQLDILIHGIAKVEGTLPGTVSGVDEQLTTAPYLLPVGQDPVLLRNDGAHSAGSLSVTLAGKTIGSFSNSNWSSFSYAKSGINFTVHDSTITLADGVTAVITGDNDTVVLGNNDTVYLTGKGAKISGGTGDSITVSGDNASVSTKGSGNTIVAIGKDATIQAADGGMIVAMGDNANVKGGSGVQAMVTGNQGTVSLGSGGSISVAGVGMAIAGSNEKIFINGSAVLAGNNNLITEAQGSILTVASNTQGNSISGYAATVNLREKTSTTLQSTANLTVSGGAGVTITETGAVNSGNVLSVGAGSAVTVVGIGDTINAKAGKATVNVSGSGDTLNATGAAISVADSVLHITVNGAGNTITEGKSAGVTATGDGNSFTIGSSSSAVITGSNEVVTAATGATGDSVTATGTGDKITLGDNSVVTLKGNGSNVLTMGKTANVTASGDANAITVGSGIVSSTGNRDVISTGGGSVTVTGNNDSVTSSGTSTIRVAGSNAVISASGSLLSFADSSSASITGSHDSISGKNETLSITGQYDPVVAINSTINFTGLNAGDLVTGSGNHGSGWANPPSASQTSANQLIQAMASYAPSGATQTALSSSTSTSALQNPLLVASH
jgi:hypothetical protein